MTPKEKAKQLIEDFASYSYYSRSDSVEAMAHNQAATAKQCALIAVDEILFCTYMDVNKYYQQVKEELQNL